ncbi:MAG: VOC family protein [Patescibacteria group bacterium]|nr:VOC family protein [Patescibacteria group bacterium]
MDFYRPFFSLIGWRGFDDTSFYSGDTKVYFVEKNTSFSNNIGPRHICFLADSRGMVDQVGDFLKTAGVKIIRGPLESSYKNRVSYTVDFKDPDGYILEVATVSAEPA